MPTRSRPGTGREKTGHADSPRQDSQRPAHSDHADAGGQESARPATARTQRAAGTPPAEAPLPPGESRPDPALPEGGRQPQRPGQDGRAEEVLGERDTLGTKKRPARRS
jgi:hypothetical protein